MSIGDLARLLLPVDGTEASVVEATERWRWEPAVIEDAPVVVWGRTSLTSGAPAAVAARHALARERALVALRRPRAAAPRRVVVHRLSPGGYSSRGRALLLGGAIVELTKGDRQPRRLLDAVAEAAGLQSALGALRSGAGGTAMVRGIRVDGTPVVLRAEVGTAGREGVPRELLARLARAGVLVPSPIASGRSDGVAWSVESALPGRMPARLSRRLLGEAIDALARFPGGLGARAAVDDLQALRAALPDREGPLASAQGWASGVASTSPAVARHGDLWSGNLLVSRGHLSGIVDWDAAHDAGVPGADLLQLVVTSDRHRRGLCLGDAWLERPWQLPEWLSAVDGYWRATGVRPNRDLLDLAGISWWAAEIAGTLRRFPARAGDERWLAANVDPVLGVAGSL